MTATAAYSRFSTTLDLLCGQADAPFEVRTNVHTGLLDEDDILTIARDLAVRGYQGPYAVQRAVIDKDNPTLGHLPAGGRSLDFARLMAESPIELHTR